MTDGIDIADTVLGAVRHERAARLPVACLAALVAHASILLVARYMGVGKQANELAGREPLRQYELDVDIPPPAPPPPAPDKAAVEPRATLLRVRDPAAARARSRDVEVARAATIVARDPEPGAPVDLTADAIVTGTATAYAGGVTASTGTGSSAASDVPSAAAQTGANASGTPARSSPVSLESESWSCPWPREADAQQIDEQTVVLRVLVDGSGDPEKVTVLADPGSGFGPAAAVCAMRTRFTPARDREGHPMRATSPPIRVRFTR